MAKTETQVSIRCTHAFKERLEAQAQRERRPVSNLIIKVLSEYLDDVEPLTKLTENDLDEWFERLPNQK